MMKDSSSPYLLCVNRRKSYVQWTNVTTNFGSHSCVHDKKGLMSQPAQENTHPPQQSHGMLGRHAGLLAFGGPMSYLQDARTRRRNHKPPRGRASKPQGCSASARLRPQEPKLNSTATYPTWKTWKPCNVETRKLEK